TPDSVLTHQALRNCALTVQISTKLNRSHLMVGRDALILPCLGRTDIDQQAAGAQCVTVEDSFSMVHASFGQLEPLSKQMRSEPWIIAGIAEATLGNHPVSWQAMRDDYRLIRDAIARTVPGFDQFEDRLKQPGGFHLPNLASQRVWRTSTEKARFSASFLPGSLIHEKGPARGQSHGALGRSRRPDDEAR